MIHFPVGALIKFQENINLLMFEKMPALCISIRLFLVEHIHINICSPIYAIWVLDFVVYASYD